MFEKIIYSDLATSALQWNHPFRITDISNVSHFTHSILIWTLRLWTDTSADFQAVKNFDINVETGTWQDTSPGFLIAGI